jgi:hypothetical protein
MGITLPENYLKIGNFYLDQFFKVGVTAPLMIDFGNSFSTVKSIVSDITKNKGNAKSIFKRF